MNLELLIKILGILGPIIGIVVFCIKRYIRKRDDQKNLESKFENLIAKWQSRISIKCKNPYESFFLFVAISRNADLCTYIKEHGEITEFREFIEWLSIKLPDWPVKMLLKQHVDYEVNWNSWRLERS